jgi:hypothetical protein
MRMADAGSDPRSRRPVIERWSAVAQLHRTARRLRETVCLNLLFLDASFLDCEPDRIVVFEG